VTCYILLSWQNSDLIGRYPTYQQVIHQCMKKSNESVLNHSGEFLEAEVKIELNDR
jgi:hypothetical protein